jgi:hypothetical protein
VLLSATRTVKSKVPALVGIPVKAPVVANVSPVGKDPVNTDHVNGGVELPKAWNV